MSSDAIDKPIRVWTNPDSGKDTASLVCLKPAALCLAVVPATELEKTAAALADRGELGVVAQNIRLAMITQLDGDEDGSDLSVTYR
jgi:hypothetical protein